MVNYVNADLETALARATTLDDLERTLAAIGDLVPSFMDPAIWGRKLFWPGLDRQLPELAARLGLVDVALTPSQDHVCILATRFYATGGHSRVAADICRRFGPERTTIIWTDLYGQFSYRQLRNGAPAEYPCRSLVLLNARSRVEKIIELHALLAALRPGRIFMLQNHMDVVAVTGAWPFRNVAEFVHHADYLPSLGATLAFARHADLTYTCHPECRSVLPQALYVGMAVEGALPDVGQERTKPRLRIATCGGAAKYRDVAAYRWTDFVIAALRSQDADIVHIGPVDSVFVEQVHAAIAADGLSPDRYRFVGPKPDLRTALIGEDADLYLGSYPEGGGRALLEALSLALPAILPEAAEQGGLLRQTLPIGGWRSIEHPDQISEAFRDALAERERLRSPSYRSQLEAEFQRFNAYLEGVDYLVD